MKTFKNIAASVAISVILLDCLCLTVTGQLYSGSRCRLPSGEKAICKPLTECEWLLKELKASRIKRGDLQKYRCSFEGISEISCCADDSPTPPPSPATSCRSDEFCFEYEYSNTEKDIKPHPTRPRNRLVFDVTTKPTPTRATTMRAPTTTTSTTTTMRPTTTTTTTTTTTMSSMPDWMQQILIEYATTTTPSPTTSTRIPTTTTTKHNDFIFGGSTSNEVTSPPPTPSSPVPATVTEPSTRSNLRRSAQACNNYTVYQRPQLDFHILNGVEVNPGEFPHMAAIGYYQQVDQTVQYSCGGTLISERYVMTAGHCATSAVVPTTVRLGTVSLIPDPDNPPVDIDVETVIRHPEYRTNRNYHDIALIRLVSAVTLGDSLYPACLNSDMADTPTTQVLTVIGYGRTQANRLPGSNVLLKTNLTSIPLEQCKESYSPTRQLSDGLIQGQLCANGGASDTCQGDSGGPIEIQLPNEMALILGITSFGISCGTETPSVYTRVAFYLDWIENTVWPE